MLFLVDLLYPNRRFHIQALAFQSRIEPEKRKKKKETRGTTRPNKTKTLGLISKSKILSKILMFQTNLYSFK